MRRVMRWNPKEPHEVGAVRCLRHRAERDLNPGSLESTVCAAGL